LIVKSNEELDEVGLQLTWKSNSKSNELKVQNASMLKLKPLQFETHKHSNETLSDRTNKSLDLKRKEQVSKFRHTFDDCPLLLLDEK
jgi:hypothetical protein